jgi:hypothetical protein
VWLVMPGGALASGAPEDVMVSGAINDTFERHRLRFDVSDRAFRLLTGHRGTAVARGRGVHAALAAAVLEREGYAVGSGAPASVEVDASETGWIAMAGDRRACGRDFASLARFVRERRTTR